ncbi:MAG: tRNA pseudouridine(55) synthase, partial [Lachnospiraceae bacterium]|nr:tRNA pseudouridine(55) synthase [Lachnospiraceae bacterium]
MYNGVLIVNKEKGFTSHDVVAKLRGILKQKKIGHTGTLDPDATGVLPVCLGHGTKLCDMLTDKDKIYEAVMLIGQATDTQDISGQVINVADANAMRADGRLDDEYIIQTVMSF